MNFLKGTSEALSARFTGYFPKTLPFNQLDITLEMFTAHFTGHLTVPLPETKAQFAFEVYFSNSSLSSLYRASLSQPP